MAPAFLRSLVDRLSAAIAGVALRVFFRKVEVIGAERIRRGVPTILIANHVNSLIDPMVVMAFVGGGPRFLAKSTLWSHPVVAPLLVLVGALPVYRRRDHAPVARNLETFRRCREVLARGGTVALFPEGTSHNEPSPLPLKTGAARIALETEDGHGPLGLRVVPIGIVYEEKERFRSRVLVQVGEAIDPAPEAARYRAAPRAAVRALTARIAAGLDGVTAPFHSWEEARLIDRAVDLATAGDPAVLPLSHRWARWREFTGRHAALERADPARALRLADDLRAYDEARRRLGLRESDLALRAPGRGPIHAWAEWMAALPGAILNWVPYQLPGWIVRRFTLTRDEPATYKVMSSLLVFPAWWALVAALAWRLGGAVMALAALVGAPALGYVTLCARDHRRLRPRPPAPASSEEAALRRTRAALVRQIQDVVGAGPW